MLLVMLRYPYMFLIEMPVCSFLVDIQNWQFYYNSKINFSKEKSLFMDANLTFFLC